MTTAKRYAAEALELVKTRVECDRENNETYVYYDAENDTFYCCGADCLDDWCLGSIVRDFDNEDYSGVDLDNDGEIAGLAEVWRGWLVDAADEYSENN